MATKSTAVNLAEILRGHQDAILEEWLKAMSGTTRRSDLMSEGELRGQAQRFLKLVSAATETAGNDLQNPAGSETKEMLGEISRTRATQGFSPSETATFVFSLKRPLFDRLREEYSRDPAMLTSMLWSTTELLDGLGLFSAE